MLKFCVCIVMMCGSMLDRRENSVQVCSFPVGVAGGEQGCNTSIAAGGVTPCFKWERVAEMIAAYATWRALLIYGMLVLCLGNYCCTQHSERRFMQAGGMTSHFMQAHTTASPSAVAARGLKAARVRHLSPLRLAPSAVVVMLREPFSKPFNFALRDLTCHSQCERLWSLVVMDTVQLASAWCLGETLT